MISLLFYSRFDDSKRIGRLASGAINVRMNDIFFLWIIQFLYQFSIIEPRINRLFCNIVGGDGGKK